MRILCISIEIDSSEPEDTNARMHWLHIAPQLNDFRADGCFIRIFYQL